MPTDDRNAPATKGDIANLRTEFKSDSATLRGEVHSDVILLQEKLTEAFQDSETRILTAFYRYAEATQKHLQLLDGTDANILSRLGSMESRLLEVEKRLNIPPGQAA